MRVGKGGRGDGCSVISNRSPRSPAAAGSEAVRGDARHPLEVPRRVIPPPPAPPADRRRRVGPSRPSPGARHRDRGLTGGGRRRPPSRSVALPSRSVAVAVARHRATARGPRSCPPPPCFFRAATPSNGYGTSLHTPAVGFGLDPVVGGARLGGAERWSPPPPASGGQHNMYHERCWE